MKFNRLVILNLNEDKFTEHNVKRQKAGMPLDTHEDIITNALAGGVLFNEILSIECIVPVESAIIGPDGELL